jgi:peptide methionine sulfoxide reductase MsrA
MEVIVAYLNVIRERFLEIEEYHQNFGEKNRESNPGSYEYGPRVPTIISIVW